MKKILLLTKTLLAAVLLCVGQNAWAAIDLEGYKVVATYDMSTIADETLAVGSENAGKSYDFGATSTTDVYTCTAPTLLAGKFAFQGVGNAWGGKGWWMDKNDGKAGNNTLLANGGGASRAAALLGLKSGQKVVFTVYDSNQNSDFQIKGGSCTYNETIETDGPTSNVISYGVSITADGSLGFSSPKYNANGRIGIISITVYGPATALLVPTFALKSLNGTSRTYTITNNETSGTIYYTTAVAEEAPVIGDAAYTSTTEASVDVTVSESGNLYAYVDVSGTKSDISSQIVSATNVTLDMPTYTVGAYSDGATSVTLYTNQNNVLLKPTANVVYTIDSGAETSVASGTSVNVSNGSTIEFWSDATGYTKSASVSLTASAPNTYPELWSESYNGIVNANDGFSLGDEATTINSTDYYSLYRNSGATLLSERLLANAVPTSGSAISMLRANGVYFPKAVSMAVINLKEGDYVIFNGVYGNGAFGISNPYNMTFDNFHSVNGSKYCYTVDSDGAVAFTLSAQGYLQSISVQRNVVTATIGSTGWTTFASPYALDLSNMTASTGSVAAYYASATSDESVTVLTTESSAVQAGEGIILKGTADATITIPVVASGSAISGNLLVGCPTATTITSETTNYDAIYVLGGDVAEFQNVKKWIDGGNTVSIPAGKAYLNASSSNGARALRISFDDITGVANVEAAAEAKAQDGKFVENGKIVIVKNGVKYNAAGQQVK